MRDGCSRSSRWRCVVRVLAVAYVHPDPRDGRYDDSVWYDTTARHLAAGDGYVFDPTVWKTADGTRIYPDENELSPTALWPPGYPLTLAVVYKVTGDSVNAARLLNILLRRGDRGAGVPDRAAAVRPRWRRSSRAA